MKYEIYRLELTGKVKMSTQCYEENDLFKLIAENPNYLIYLDGKDVTKLYKSRKRNN